MKTRLLLSLALTVICLVSGTAFAEPHCQPCPYSCYDLGLGKKDCSDVSESRGICCVDLSSRGFKLAKEQERLLGSKNNSYGNTQERCPAGFQQSEQKCSPDERRRGCKDIRLNNGIGCVKR